ncbi:10472_t:CDS:2 [Paraglomus brasilianum]|uniref:10472_t:CDS:1 n=1 Tax=Paraglomus brasilianum TaxID=144538 RepID=A0A9N9A3E4_9GLOM|nr:10472_t:CDS:2 [Paraglomus brasilianum]
MSTLLRRTKTALEKLAPLSLAEPWDNVGVLVDPPYPRPSASKVFLTIDFTEAVAEEALGDEKVGVVVAYHPPIFRPWKRLEMADVKQRIMMKCIAKGLGIYSPHTAVDACSGGVNDWLSSALGFPGVLKPIVPASNIPEGQETVGSGRIMTFHKPVSLDLIIKEVKQRLDLKYVRVARALRHKEPSSQNISTVGICAGSGASVLSPIKVDLYFTGELSHHEVLAALAQDTSDHSSIVVDRFLSGEHSNTERGYLTKVLKPHLEKLLREDGDDEAVEVVVSSIDRDPLDIV